MRSGAAAGHDGYFHESAFYHSDDEFLGIVAPFFADGVSAGEPVIAAFAPANQRLIRKEFGEHDVRFLDGEAQYLRPAGAIRRYRELFAECVSEGATQIRVAGDVPHPGTGSPWDCWARYEASVNRLYNDFPVWGLCPYDLRTAPADVVDEVRRTHPFLATTHGHQDNAAFVDPVAFLSGRVDRWADPLEQTPAAVELADPTPTEVRQAIATVSDLVDLSDEDRTGLLVAVSEVVTNAILYGAAPVRTRIWTGPDRILVTVTDRGEGVTDPFAGLTFPASSQPGGRGLSLAHQLCGYVQLRHDTAGFTVCLVAGTPAVR